MYLHEALSVNVFLFVCLFVCLIVDSCIAYT